MPDIHASVCCTFASFLGCSHYKPASNYILTFCFYHSESGGGQKGEELANTHGSNHKHFPTFTWFCNTNKPDMPSSEGRRISACRCFQLPNQCFALCEASGFNTDFAACFNHSDSYEYTGVPPAGYNGGCHPRNCLVWAGQPPAALFYHSGQPMGICLLDVFT